MTYARLDRGIVDLPCAHHGREHDGDVGVVAAPGPLEYRTDAQIAFGNEESVHHLLRMCKAWQETWMRTVSEKHANM